MLFGGVAKEIDAQYIINLILSSPHRIKQQNNPLFIKVGRLDLIQNRSSLIYAKFDAEEKASRFTARPAFPSLQKLNRNGRDLFLCDKKRTNSLSKREAINKFCLTKFCAVVYCGNC